MEKFIDKLKQLKKLRACFLSVVVAAFVLSSCQNDTYAYLGGKTYSFESGYGSSYGKVSYSFRHDGGVSIYIRVGYYSEVESDDMYYVMDGSDFAIYYGTRDWKPEYQNTVYSRGTYYGDYVIIDGTMYYLE